MPEQLRKIGKDLQGLLQADGLCLWCGELAYIAMPVVSFPDTGGAPAFMVPRLDGDFVSTRDPAAAGALIPPSMRSTLPEQGLSGAAFARRTLGPEKNVGLLAAWNPGHAMPENVDEISRMALVLIGQEIWRAAANRNLLDYDPQMHAVADALPQGLVVVPVDGRRGFVNRTAAELLATPAGEAEPEILAGALRGLVGRALNRDEVRTFAAGVLGSAKTIAERRTLVWRFQHKPRALRVTISPILAPELSAWSWLLEDVTAEIELQDEVAANARKFQQFYQTLRDPVVFYDLDGRPTECNAALQKLIGADCANIAELTPQRLGWPVDGWAGVLRECLDTGYCAPRERQLQTDAGQPVQVEVMAHLRRNASGEPDGVWEVMHDITERKQAEAQLMLAAEAFARHTDGVVLTDAEMVILTVNDAFARECGYSREEIRGKTPGLLKSGREGADFYRQMRHDIQASGWWQGGIWSRRKNGELFFKWLTVNAIRNAANELTHYIGVYRDAAVVDAQQRQIEYLATHDKLTRLPNELLFEDRLQMALSRPREPGSLLGVVLLHVDGLPDINNARGHATGDLVLQEVARRLLAFSPGRHSVARLSGNRFGLLLEAPHVQALADHGDALLQAMAPPHTPSGAPIVVRVSLGVSVSPSDGAQTQDLLLKASAALGRARERGGGVCQFYAEEMVRKITERFELEHGLRQALACGQFFLQYQPQVAMHDESIGGCEALLRWRAPGGVVPPGAFIAVAEMSDLIIPITEWVLRQVCRDVRGWDARGVHVPTVSVNFSARHFMQDGMAARLIQILDEERLAPQRICVEITEGAFADPEQCAQKLAALKDAGFSISVDDFGTGFSSLAYLKRFRLDELKIDRSFVMGIEENEGDRAIASAILSLAHSLKLHVVAEGVELAEQAAYLKERGCDLIQGYLYSRPLDAASFEAFARRRPAPGGRPGALNGSAGHPSECRSLPRA